jgi:hypothetical protein
MLKLATILDNPGEPFAETRYRDPRKLRQLGYNGLVLYETTGLSGVDSPERVGTGEVGRWVAQQFDAVRTRIDQARAADLNVYVSYDALSLARAIVEKNPAQFVCRNRPTSLCPASDAALELSVQSLAKLLAHLPDVQGVVLRFGDNDAARLPYLVGNDLYTPHCPRCSQFGRADRIVGVVKKFHDLVVQKLGKTLIVRTWNVRPGGLHDSVELCTRVAARLPAADPQGRFILSFKFTQTDFWRYQRWNPASLVWGDRPILYELQCQREFEGKGGIPNWQVPLWQQGGPEVSGEGPRGLIEAAQRVPLAGLWAWVRGGGWGGPFVSNETWIDANAYAVPRLADQPAIPAATLAREWIDQRLGISDPQVADVLVQILEHSSQIVLKGFYIGPYARTKKEPWHPNADWIQDDVVDAQAAWRMIQQLADSALDDAVQEKSEAVEQIAHDRAALQHHSEDRHQQTIDPLLNTLVYAESLLEALRDLIAGLAAYRRFQRQRDAATAETCRQRLMAAQSHWSHHTQRHGSLPGAATSFRETHFWDLTQRILGEVMAPAK